jgi:hypothetical protein
MSVVPQGALSRDFYKVDLRISQKFSFQGIQMSSKSISKQANAVKFTYGCERRNARPERPDSLCQLGQMAPGCVPDAMEERRASACDEIRSDPRRHHARRSRSARSPAGTFSMGHTTPTATTLRLSGRRDGYGLTCAR